MLVIRATEYDRPHFNARELVRRHLAFNCLHEGLAPMAIDPVYSSDLLFHHAGVPFGMQYYHDSARRVEV